MVMQNCRQRPALAQLCDCMDKLPLFLLNSGIAVHLVHLGLDAVYDHRHQLKHGLRLRHHPVMQAVLVSFRFVMQFGFAASS